ncbi:MAG: metal ABC transporter ATP-binding protein [bacterium]
MRSKNEYKKIPSGKTCNHCCTKIENLTVKIGGTLILDSIDLHVDCGEIIALVGPNGAGKTTLLRTILGEIPYQGQLFFQVKGHVSRRPRIGYMPQKLQFDMDSPISVADLVATTISRHPVWLGINRQLLKKVQNVLALFSVEHLYARKVGELSGGELQRVLLAIAMTPEPDLLLLDEAGSGVDLKGLSLFYQIVSDLKKKYDVSVILVTHDLAGISSFADRIILLNHSVIAQGNPKEVFSDEKLLKAFGIGLWNISHLMASRPGDN